MQECIQRVLIYVVIRRFMIRSTTVKNESKLKEVATLLGTAFCEVNLHAPWTNF